jgi:methylated-DNA-protein-cysteine methyltransferase-like protein
MVKDHAQKRNTFDIIYAVVKEIPCGRIATYGQIAAIISPGLPARIVGYALHGLPDDTDVPWHRVINRQGKISYAVSRNELESLQQKILEQEGIQFSSDGRIDLDKYRWFPNLMNK